MFSFSCPILCMHLPLCRRRVEGCHCALIHACAPVLTCPCMYACMGLAWCMWRASCMYWDACGRSKGRGKEWMPCPEKSALQKCMKRAPKSQNINMHTRKCNQVKKIHSSPPMGKRKNSPSRSGKGKGENRDDASMPPGAGEPTTRTCT